MYSIHGRKNLSMVGGVNHEEVLFNLSHCPPKITMRGVIHSSVRQRACYLHFFLWM